MTVVSLAGPPPEARRGSQGLLRPHQAQPHLRPVLRRQQQRHPQEAPQHGGEDMRLSMRHIWMPLWGSLTLERKWTSGWRKRSDLGLHYSA